MQLNEAADMLGVHYQGCADARVIDQKLGAETTEVTTASPAGCRVAAGTEVKGSSDTGRKRRLASVRAGYHTGSARDFADRAAADRRLELPAR